MAKRKMTKEELEQDPLLTSYDRFLEFYEDNRNLVLYSGIAVTLVLVLGIGFYFYMQTQENRAQQLMAYAEQYYRNGEYEQALTGSEAEFTVGFEQIIDNYWGTDAANLARYYAAVCEYNLGNTNRALTYIEEYDMPDGIMGVGPLSFHGVVLTELDMHAEAADKYVQAAEWDQNDSTTPYNLLEATHAYYEAGDNEQARRYADRIIEEYPDSPQVAEAKRMVGQLAVRSPAGSQQ